ncbi:hypothetical protein [Nocardia fusca]|uniref:hypothetical protein n=1 Tax=Nocardia fusca TaxID=941183 RepID=UPI000A7C8523|nr:hypothetical protein [Nocardia fusca]
MNEPVLRFDSASGAHPSAPGTPDTGPAQYGDSALIIDVGRLGLLSLRTLAAVADDELPPVLRAPMFVHSECWLPTSAS